MIGNHFYIDSLFDFHEHYGSLVFTVRIIIVIVYLFTKRFSFQVLLYLSPYNIFHYFDLLVLQRSHIIMPCTCNDIKSFILLVCHGDCAS